MDRRLPVTLLLEDDTDCPVCGLGFAFAAPRHYDVCLRCEWVDDPAAYADAASRCETNDDSLDGAKRSWPERLVRRLADAPLTAFGLAMRDDDIGGFDYLVDGVSVRSVFRRGRDLKASIGPWPVDAGWLDALLSGEPVTPTGRSRLYVCHLCGGDDEPALTADLHVGAERVIWSRIGLESRDVDAANPSLDLRRGPAGFAFDAAEYRRALAAARPAK